MARKPIETKSFKVEGDFKSMYAAEAWLKEKGYSTGSSCVGKPTAIMKGNYYDYDLPHKMKNFSKEQTASVHGIMFGDNRNGTVYVHLYE